MTAEEVEERADVAREDPNEDAEREADREPRAKADHAEQQQPQPQQVLV